MKTRVKKFKSKGFYCLKRSSSANSLFFEDDKDQHLFIGLLDRFLGDMIKLHAYSTNATGWTLCFSTKEESAIRKSFMESKQKLKKAKIFDEKIDTAQMLSEHFRFFLRVYVKQSNFRHKRHGVRVHSNMEKYIFGKKEDFEEEIKEMKIMKENEIQQAKYRPYMRYYLVEKGFSLAKLVCGINGKKLVKSVISCYQEILGKAQLLRELINRTWALHLNAKINLTLPQDYIKIKGFKLMCGVGSN